MIERDDDVSDELYQAAVKRLEAWGDEYQRIKAALSETAGDPEERPVRHQRLAAWKETIARALGRAQSGTAEDPRWKRSRRECLECGHRASPRRWGKYLGAGRRKGRVKRIAWSSDACPKCGSTSYRIATLTARGRETRSGAASLGLAALSTEALRTEALLKRLTPEERDVIARKFRIRQKDEDACRDLRVRKGVYRLWVDAAIAQFAIVLAEDAKRNVDAGKRAAHYIQRVTH